MLILHLHLKIILWIKYKESYLGLTDYNLARNNKIKHSTIEMAWLKWEKRNCRMAKLKQPLYMNLVMHLDLDIVIMKSDIMYPYISPDSISQMNFHDLSTGDIEAIKSAVDLGFKNQYKIKSSRRL